MESDARRPSAVAFAAIVAALSLVLLVAGARGWFVFDDWTFLSSRRALLARGDVGGYFFLPHNEHLSVTFIAWHLAVTHLFGLGTYVPTMVSLLLLDVVLLVAMRLVLLRVGVRPWFAALAPPALLVWGPIASWVLWGFDGSFVAGVTAVFVQALLVWHDGPPDRRDAGGSLVAVLGTGAQTLTLFGVAAIGGVLVAQRRFRAALIAVGPTAVLYGLWHVTYGQREAVYQWLPTEPRFHLPPAAISDQAAFFGRLASASAGGFLPSVVGWVVVPAVIATVLTHAIRNRHPARGVLLGGVAVALAFAVAVSHQRALIGSGFAAAERYVFVVTVFVFPVMVLGLQQAWDWVRPRLGHARAVVVLVTLVAGVLTFDVADFVDARSTTERVMRTTREHINTLAADPALDELPGELRVDMFSWDLNMEHLRFLRDHWLLRPETDPSPALVVDQQARYFIRAEPARAGDRAPAGGPAEYGRTEPGSRPGCVIGWPDDISKWGRVWVPVTPGADGPVAVEVTTSLDQVEFLVRRGSVVTLPHQVHFDGRPVTLRVTTRPGDEAFVLLPAGGEVCPAPVR